MHDAQAREYEPIADVGLDDPIYGVPAIAKVVKLPEEKCYYHLKHGHLDASKFGKLWTSTRRRLLKSIQGEA